MATTPRPTKNRSGTNGGGPAARPRVRVSARGAAGATDSRESQYDLLTAALLGLAIGAGTTYLLRRGPSGRRPIAPAWRAAGAGALGGARPARRGAHLGSDCGLD